MYGADIGELAMYIGKVTSGQRQWDLKWYLAGPQSVDDKDWLYGQFGISSLEQYQVNIL